MYVWIYKKLPSYFLISKVWVLVAPHPLPTLGVDIVSLLNFSHLMNAQSAWLIFTFLIKILSTFHVLTGNVLRDNFQMKLLNAHSLKKITGILCCSANKRTNLESESFKYKTITNGGWEENYLHLCRHFKNLLILISIT